MSLSPDTRIGLYEILAPLGAVGMGDVYRARDTKLQRDVAISPSSGQLIEDSLERLIGGTIATLGHSRLA